MEGFAGGGVALALKVEALADDTVFGGFFGKLKQLLFL